MENFVKTFHLDIWTIVAQAINFAIVVFVLYRFVIKPLQKVLDERSNMVSKSHNDAKENEEILLATKKKYDEALTEARKEANNIIALAKKDAEIKRAELIEKTQAEIVAMGVSAKQMLAQEKNKMIDDARHELAGIVMSATEKVLGKTVTGKIDEKLIEESLK
jgi:F-type H+-transporting ATPase subunit b